MPGLPGKQKQGEVRGPRSPVSQWLGCHLSPSAQSGSSILVENCFNNPYFVLFALNTESREYVLLYYLPAWCGVLPPVPALNASALQRAAAFPWV